MTPPRRDLARSALVRSPDRHNPARPSVSDPQGSGRLAFPPSEDIISPVPNGESKTMADATRIFLLANMALAFYLVGAIWAHEVDIFRSWKLVDVKDFHSVQRAHWRKLSYWIFAPLGLAFVGSVGLVWFHPKGSPSWAIKGNLALLSSSFLLTAIFWGRWQAKLSKDSAGPQSIYLARILRTHWVRTALISAYAFVILAWAMSLFS